MTAFGTVFTDEMMISWNDGNGWSAPEFVPSDSLNLHPAAHVLHYSSTCFEGLKAFRHPDGSVKIFRLDQNIKRFVQSSDFELTNRIQHSEGRRPRSYFCYSAHRVRT